MFFFQFQKRSEHSLLCDTLGALFIFNFSFFLRIIKGIIGEAFRLNPLSQVPRSKLSVCLGHYKQFMSKMKQRNSNGGGILPVTHNPLIGASLPRSLLPNTSIDYASRCLKMLKDAFALPLRRGGSYLPKRRRAVRFSLLGFGHPD